MGSFLIYRHIKENKNNNVVLTDAQKFHNEYSGVDVDNVFVYKNIDDIINILEHGTGVVYLGYPECPWCQAYVKYLSESAKNAGLEKIYYFNIKEDRSSNSDKYQQIVKLLGDNLQYDDEGNKRVYVPDVTIVKDGKIIGHDCETSKDTGGLKNPSDYWTEEKIKKLENKLEKMFAKVSTTTCTDCNIK
jgi:predicted bacteriocin transport accessory protein